MNYAVISNPRTGSRSLAKNLAADTGNPIGYLHFAQDVDSYCLTYEELISQNWTLHGHWHTLHLLPKEHINYIKNNYYIVEIKRDPFHAFISAIITMATKNIDFTKDDIPSVIDLKLVEKYFYRMCFAEQNRLDLSVDLCYNFNKLYSNKSNENFYRNIANIKNYKELEESYLTHYKEVCLC